jgi:hypothetical protein
MDLYMDIPLVVSYSTIYSKVFVSSSDFFLLPNSMNYLK